MANRKSRKCPFSSRKMLFCASKPRKTSRIARNYAYMAKPAHTQHHSSPPNVIRSGPYSLCAHINAQICSFHVKQRGKPRSSGSQNAINVLLYRISMAQIAKTVVARHHCGKKIAGKSRERIKSTPRVNINALSPKTVTPERRMAAERPQSARNWHFCAKVPQNAA